MVMYSEEKVSKKEATKIMFENIDSDYDKADLEQVAANEVQMSYDERTKLLGLLK